MPPHALPPSDDAVIAETRAWIERAVIGLNLCPFAKAVYVREQIRYVVSAATSPESLLAQLESELQFIAQADPTKVDTTLLIHPRVLADFFDYNDFLELADESIERLDLVGEIQIASFHPEYQFADTGADDVSNYTNRSPFAMLHLLRETSIEKAVATYPDTAKIHERNIETMRRLGAAGVKALRSGRADKPSDSA